MTDPITIERIKLLHPAIRAEVEHAYIAQVVPALAGSVKCRFSYTLRTFPEQNSLYAIGRTKLYDAKGNRLGKVTNARGGQSFHNFGLAYDIVLLKGTGISYETNIDFDKDGRSDWMEVINIFKNIGFEWGGDWTRFKDKPHMQKTFGYSTKELLQKHNNNQFIPGTRYVKL